MARLVPRRSAFKLITTITSFACMAFTTVTHARAATLAVPAGGSLQSALNAAQPGDVITLEPGVTYVGVI